MSGPRRSAVGSAAQPELLPTQTASYHLEELSLQGKQYQKAASYFELAAQSNGFRSAVAKRQVQLQLKPQSFLTLSTSVSGSGYLLVTVRITARRQ